MNEADRIREAYRHCEQLVRAHAKDHFLASLFAPAERRPYLLALYAFAIEIAHVKMLVTEPITGAIRLQWWREAIDGLREAEAAASPVMIALQDAARRTDISLAPLTGAIDAREAELYGTPPIGASSAIVIMAARFLGAEADGIAVAADAAAQAVTFSGDPQEAKKARDAYVTFRSQVENLSERVLPAFLTVCLVPLRLKYPDTSQWRRQIALLRTAWFGFPRM